jgi:hypothetical protein
MMIRFEGLPVVRCELGYIGSLSASSRGTNPDSASRVDAQLFCYALYLMAKWREPRAYRS